jgi:hypothetical protein
VPPDRVYVRGCCPRKLRGQHSFWGQEYLRKKPNKTLFAPFAAVHCELLPVTSSSLRPLRNLRVLCDLGLSLSHLI